MCSSPSLQTNLSNGKQDMVALASVTTIVCNETTLVGDNWNSLNSQFPFGRLESVDSVDDKSYVYHQLNESMLLEEVCTDEVGGFGPGNSVSIVIPTS